MKEKNRVGRPDKFTPERRKSIIDDIAHAIPYELAAEGNGISEETLYAWLRIARQHQEEGIDSDYTKFSEDIKKAENNRIKKHLSKIEENIDRWQADAWTLERRWWKYYGTNAAIVEFNKRLEQMEKDHGRQTEEVDKICNQASGRIEEGITCQERRENSCE